MDCEYAVKTWHTAGAFLNACGQQLMKQRSISANFALATSFDIATGRQTNEGLGESKDLWISASPATRDQHEDVVPLYVVTIVGKHSNRLASSIDPTKFPQYEVEEAMRALVRTAKDAGIPGSRIFGVIGPKALCVPFSNAWAAAYGLHAKPVLDFAITHVTRSTLRPSTRTIPENVVFGLCTPANLNIAAEMCERATHPMDEPTPPPLDAAGARVHANKLIAGQCLYGAWVDGVLRTLVSITRETPLVRAVSKVYTVPEARGQGLAEGLVRYAIAR